MAGFISLADAKAHLRVLHDEEDVGIQALIDAASELIELETGYVAVEREAETFAFDRFDRVLELRKRPVDPETIVVGYLDTNGEAQRFTDRRVYVKQDTVRIVPAPGHVWPRALCGQGAVTVSATVGFGATAEAGAAGAPETVKHLIRLLVAYWYDNRGAAESGSVDADLRIAIRSLFEPNRMLRV
ncbi:MAG: hypothetical protein GW859_04725 [Sphingomonadales bacterium]|nr:hypothetical protein [Sphingomonadales bacterium]